MAHNAGLTTVTSTDQRGWLWVTTILSIVYTVSVLIARLFGKYGMLWYDDATLGSAYCLALVRWGIQMNAMSYGLGADLLLLRVLSSDSSVAIQAFAARVLLVACLYLAKLSIVVFSQKIFTGNLNHEIVVFGTAYSIIAVSAVGSILAAATACAPAHYLLGKEVMVCPETLARSVIICLLHILSEIAIIGVPVILLSKLQMPQSKKRAVYIVFLARLGVLALDIGQAVAYQRFLDREGRASIGLLPTLCLQKLWLMYSFVSATIPCMRAFLGAFSSPKLAVANPSTTGHHSYANRGTALSTLRRTFRSGGGGAEDGDALTEISRKGDFRPDGPFYGVDIRHEERKRAGEGDSLASDGSEQMIIRRDTRIHVEQERLDDPGIGVPRYAGQAR